MRSKKTLDELMAMHGDVTFPGIDPALQDYTRKLEEFLTANLGDLDQFRYDPDERKFEWRVDSGAFIEGQWTEMHTWFSWEPLLANVPAQLEAGRMRQKVWRDAVDAINKPPCPCLDGSCAVCDDRLESWQEAKDKR